MGSFLCIYATSEYHSFSIFLHLQRCLSGKKRASLSLSCSLSVSCGCYTYSYVHVRIDPVEYMTNEWSTGFGPNSDNYIQCVSLVFSLQFSYITRNKSYRGKVFKKTVPLQLLKISGWQNQTGANQRNTLYSRKVSYIFSDRNSCVCLRMCSTCLRTYVAAGAHLTDDFSRSITC